MEKLIIIQEKLKAPKNQFNSFGKYNYRSCEDILEAVKPLLAENGCQLTLTDEVKESGGVIYIESEACITHNEEVVSVKACAGIETSKKGFDLSQSFGSSSSYARKYALNGLFLIDDEKDADTNEHHNKVNEAKSNTPSKEFKSDKPWLNPKTEQWEKAVDYLLKNGSMSEIKIKYLISKVNEEKLANEVIEKS